MIISILRKDTSFQSHLVKAEKEALNRRVEARRSNPIKKKSWSVVLQKNSWAASRTSNFRQPFLLAAHPSWRLVNVAAKHPGYLDDKTNKDYCLVVSPSKEIKTKTKLEIK